MQRPFPTARYGSWRPEKRKTPSSPSISEREANAVWKEALYNPDVARQLSVAAKGGIATPIQLKRMHNYLLAVGVHDEQEAQQRQ